MPRGEIKYWVFHQEQLDAQLDAFLREHMALGGTEFEARAEAQAIRWFLTESEAGKPLRGGGAG